MDDLLDIDWSSSSSSPSAAAAAAAAAAAKPANTRLSNVNRPATSSSSSNASSTYNFDALTRSMPKGTANAGVQRPSSATGTTQKASSGDAFSSLLGFGGPATNNSTMSMADRLKQNSASVASRAPQQQKPVATKRNDEAWAGLDDFMSTSSSAAKPPVKQKVNEDSWSFDFDRSAKEAPRKPPTTSSKQATKAKDPFDFSEFEDPGDSQSSALGGANDDGLSTKPVASASNGRKKHNFLDDSGDFDDEEREGILSAFDRPTQRETPQEAPAIIRTGVNSPPPHIIGQVVEMGFSPQQARQALAATSNGVDVAAAIELLLKQSGGAQSGRQNGGRGEEEQRDRRLAARLQREENERRTPDERRRQVGSNGTSRSETPVDWQKQADQLYAQASEMGASMFSKANALWATAKSQAQKALDEHAASSGQNSGRSSPASGSERARNRRWAVPSRDGGAGAKREWQGKPKWMLEAEGGVENETENRKETPGQSFRDDDEGEVSEAPPFFQGSQAAKAKVDKQPQPQQPQQARTQHDLWQDDERFNDTKPVAATRKPAAQTTTAPTSRPKNVSSAPKPSSKPTLRQRSPMQDDANAVAQASQHKQRGNEHFKRGAYGEAETAYTSALGALEANASSLRRVALFNNRANAKLKNGDAKGALDDTMAVLRLIVVQEHERSSPFLLYRPSLEAPLPTPEYAEVNLREGYAKALLRRAQAEEMLERWDPALSVWSLLEKYEREEGSGPNGVTNMRSAKEGKGRCDKMLKKGDATAATVPNPRVRAAAAQAVAKAEAQAKARIRAENAAAAAEDAAKDGLRDAVDARIAAWKTGKENNVRALLASLHDVVWPSLAWKRVGMHEVVMDNQVKKVYMRAIGKLHPDKLTPKNNTIEERMIGGAVFSVLNDAWAAAPH